MRIAIILVSASLALGCAVAESPNVGSLPLSLQGTDADGALALDASGRFVADDDAILLFDYFLTAEGEIETDAVRALALAEIDARLSGDGEAADAADALARYLEYRAGLAEIISDVDETPEGALARMEELHAQTVADMPGLAGDPIAFRRAAALHRVLTDPGLDVSARRTAVARIEAELAAPDRGDALAARADSRRALDLRAAEAALTARRIAVPNATTPTAAEVHALRVERVGAEAADRLAALDRERAAFRARLADYRADRDAMLAALPAGADRDAALSALRARHFAPTELARVAALDR